MATTLNAILKRPDQFKRLCQDINDLYATCKDNFDGALPDQVSQLSRFNANNFAVSICTVNNDRHSIGDSKMSFSIEGLCKALNYAIVVNDIGSAAIHDYIGHEPSNSNAAGFNELCLNQNNKPHNPLTDSGAIVLVSLLASNLPVPERFDTIFNQYRQLAGDEYIGFSNSFYLNAKRTLLDGHLATGYFMQDANVFPKGAKLHETLDLYLQFCSVEATTESCAAIAATFANGGICPLTGQRVINAEAVRNTLSLMHSCGMGDHSGMFAFKVGLPAKSSVTGAIIVVIPGVLGLCVWSPALDELKNSVRGVQFCENLVNMYRLHKFDYVPKVERYQEMETATAVVALLFSAAKGDLSMLMSYYVHDPGFLSQADYDGRTALHLGSAEGQLEIVKFLHEKGHVDLCPKDRWGFTPLDEAQRNNHTHIIEYLQKAISNTVVPAIEELAIQDDSGDVIQDDIGDS